ncbi:hypothetical protein JHK82_024513 [Glycine max]|nr:hypothetical protein JHK85_025111 [Glycine max]KAG5012350.1 hypothetical protein JHK86_024611 [Glycine max]KAG5133325.1 hypothetical protein JHK82_024513 [Glycine max]
MTPKGESRVVIWQWALASARCSLTSTSIGEEKRESAVRVLRGETDAMGLGRGIFAAMSSTISPSRTCLTHGTTTKDMQSPLPHVTSELNSASPTSLIPLENEWVPNCDEELKPKVGKTI